MDPLSRPGNHDIVALPSVRDKVPGGDGRADGRGGNEAFAAGDEDLHDGARRPITLADVAREARVGESTVSRVLRSHGSFSEKTRARVEEAVARLGYVPNRIAGTLASTGSRLIGIVIPSLTNIVFPDLLRGATAALDQEGFQSVIAVTDYDQDREEAVVGSLLSWRPAGLIVTGLEHNPGTRRRLVASGVRVAELLDIDGPGLDIVVGYSNRAAGAASARHLAGRGYRRIGYIGHDLTKDRRAAKRYAGFREGLTEVGLVLAGEERVASPSSVEAGRHGLEALLARCRTSTRRISRTTTWRSAAISTASPAASRCRSGWPCSAITASMSAG